MRWYSAGRTDLATDRVSSLVAVWHDGYRDGNPAARRRLSTAYHGR